MRRSASLASALLLLLCSTPATAVTLGYVESWPDSGNLAQWRGGVAYGTSRPLVLVR